MFEITWVGTVRPSVVRVERAGAPRPEGCLKMPATERRFPGRGPTVTGVPIGESDAVRRLVQRLGLGPARGELETAQAAGFDATLAALTTPGPDPAVDATPAPTFEVPARRAGKDDLAARQRQRQEAAAQGRDLGVWWLDRMAAVTRPFPERLAWFWHGHFATSVQKVKVASLMHGQNETQRKLGGGDFRVLARAMLVDPAMLIWLDGTGNRVGRPNENLAREFMELFTLGVGNYTETDVREAARALTGWKIDLAAGTAAPVAREHDGGPESVLGATGSFDAASLTDLLVAMPVSARFVAGRVWTRLVSDAPPDAATLDALVAAYGPGHDVTALVRATAAAPAFRDPASVLVRQPVEWLVAALRALRVPASALRPAAVLSGLTGLGQIPFAPPNVGGWPAGTPWLTTAAALARIKLAQAVVMVGDISPVTDVAPAGRVEAASALLGLAPFTARTAAALAPLAGNPPQLVAAALASPENAVSA
jgi:uncharacterized protein (DUF1800 family)